MSTTKYTLSDFTVGCGGIWQNAIFIPCGHCCKPCGIRRCGCLMSGSISGEPILIGVRRYEQLTGHRIDPSQCAAILSRTAFESAYTRYLLWELDSVGECPLQKLEQKVHAESFLPIKSTDQQGGYQ